ncbi:MAG: HAMP domain-containing histidine kinase [Gaiella sp.]|nr:HAMP domain-containing histidine kinase [Gaiella sp.]
MAALTALAAASGELPAAERPRALRLAIAAARDVARILADPELVSLRRAPVDLGGLVNAFRAETVEVSVAGHPCVEADPTRLRQALANLVANGLRHGTQVRIEVGESGACVVVEVVDDGPGVDPDVDVFARGVSGAGSTGLGLWLAHSIAEAHGGSLELVPGSGPGARFRLSLPSASAAG